MNIRPNLIAFLLLAGVLSCTQRSTRIAKHIFNRKEPVKRNCAGVKIIKCNTCYQPYILKADGKIFESPLIDTTAGEEINKTIKRSWIQSYDLLIDEDVCTRHGRPGRTFGVSLLTLKAGTLEKMPPDLRNRFITEEIESIRIEVSERHGFSEPLRISLIEFQRNESGIFLLTKHTVNEKKKRFGKATKIDKQRISTFMEWEKSNRRKFDVNDFVNNKSPLYRKVSEAIKIDTFKFCQDYSDLSYVTGREYSIEITVKAPTYSNLIFQHRTQNDCISRLDLRGYLLAYKLLGNKLPARFPKAEFFKEAKFRAFLTRYAQTLKCEDFYYDEFVKKHSERTSAENRVRASWDFEKYVKERNK